MKSTLDDFKAFLLRGNVVDLAVAVVIGTAFGLVIKAFIDDVISPLLAAFGGTPNFSGAWQVTVNHATFKFGDFVTVIIYFVILAAIVFFFVVRPVNYLMSRRKTSLPVEPTTRACPYCVSEIPLKATRCAFCTAEVPAVEPVAVASAAVKQ